MSDSLISMDAIWRGVAFLTNPEKIAGFDSLESTIGLEGRKLLLNLGSEREGIGAVVDDKELRIVRL